MKEFSPLINEIIAIINNFEEIKKNEVGHSKYLDGYPSKYLTKNISIDKIKNYGIFFTPSYIADKLANNLIKEINENKKIIDITCGVGDLLIACAKYFPLERSLQKTLDVWGNRLIGYEIHPEFVRTSKARLILLALQRGLNIKNSINIDEYFSNLTVSDSYNYPPIIDPTSAVILNPPYNTIVAPDDCSWGTGKVSMAAIYIDRVLKKSQIGTKIVALLPDVLRSGTRYQRWREFVASKASIEEVEIIGKFNELTDVDVFILKLKVENNGKFIQKKEWWGDESDSKIVKRVEDIFEIKIGPVVPFRDLQVGTEHPYIDCRSIDWWKTNSDISKRRKYDGNTFNPPFVVVRRTSNPSESERAKAAIILGDKPVAVENHLIVLKPFSNKLTDCKVLLEILKSASTNEWLNNRIRCRHLTKSAISKLPWSK